MTWLALLLILLAAGFVWLVRKPDSLDDDKEVPPSEIAGVEDADELARAEREVQSAHSPDDIQDWGPGAAKPPL